MPAGGDRDVHARVAVLLVGLLPTLDHARDFAVDLDHVHRGVVVDIGYELALDAGTVVARPPLRDIRLVENGDDRVDVRGER